MNQNKKEELGIKYKVNKVNDNTFILLPIDIVRGYSIGELFYSTTIEKTLYNQASLEEEELIDSIINIEFLKGIYKYEEVDEKFLQDFYYAEESDYIILVEKTKTGIFRRKIDLKQIVKNEFTETYERQKDVPVVTLNCDALDQLLNSLSTSEMKEKLENYRRLIKEFRDKEKKEGITNITVTNGHVSEINLNQKVVSKNTSSPQQIIKKSKTSNEFDLSDYTVSGLEKYIKERVIGHDEIISDLATVIFMNFRAKEEYGTQPILLLGETGTGKTITMKCASEYFGLPFEEINTPNIVPQGIKGTTLEDHLYSLIAKCDYDIKKAQRAFIFLDEFDKIGRSGLEIKASVKDIFLKFFEGGEFYIDKPSDDYVFNTKMLNKTFAGAFSDLFEQKSAMGFGTTQQPEKTVFKESKIVESEYFGKELITRIPHKLVYYPLTREEKKLVLLESKLSQYILKKKRYKEEFGIELELTDDYIEAVLDLLSTKEKSMRDLNNIVLNNLLPAERALLESPLGKYKKLTLTQDTVSNRYNFELK